MSEGPKGLRSSATLRYGLQRCTSQYYLVFNDLAFLVDLAKVGLVVPISGHYGGFDSPQKWNLCLWI